ncbi:MAG: gtaB [Acidimicrobiaceae bacterium]|nr:gtaB [Acidimicrobiaceae bacterium]
MNKVRIAVVPAAGLGTRLRPATDAVPKELLPVGGRPAIDWALEEAAAAGIEEVIVVSSTHKPAIESFLSHSRRVRARFEGLTAIAPGEHSIRVRVVFQNEPRGLGDAVRLGWHAAGERSIAVMLPDELLLGGPLLLRSMLEHHARHGASIVSLAKFSPKEIGAYGSASLAGPGRSGTMKIDGFVEKPAQGQAPSCYGLTGRYVLGPEVLKVLEALEAPIASELSLTTALDACASTSGLLGIELIASDRRVDVGSWPGWMEANIATLGSLANKPPVRGHSDARSTAA